MPARFEKTACDPEDRRAYSPAFRQAILDPDTPEPDLICGPHGKAVQKRFNVYRNNVTHSLVSALGEIFPAIRKLVGETYFAAMARAYMRAEPPKSRLVFEYGAGFARFLENFEPARKLPYLPDIARLERAWLDAYHAADMLPLSSEALAAIASEKLPVVRFQPHPAARIIASPYAVLSIFNANRGGEKEPGRIKAATPECVLVTRPELTVNLYRLTPAVAIFFQQLLAGSTLQDAAQQAFEQDGQFDLGAAIALLVESGAFSAVKF